MKIAVLCPHYGYINRGTENMTDDINNILVEHGYEKDIISLDEKADIKINSIRKDRGIGKYSDKFANKTFIGAALRKYVGITPHIEDIAFSLRAYTKLESIVNNYDLLWSNGEYWCATLLNKLRKKYGKPILIFFGGGISAMMQKEAEMYPDIFVVLTPTMKKWVEKKVPKCNVKCIPSGVNLDLFTPKVKPLDLDGLEHPIVVSTSALTEGKRIGLTIDAMHKLGRGTMIVTSNGPMREQLISKGKALLGDRFKYLGVIPFEDLPRLYTLSDVFVLASRNEPWGAVILEAMACNTPVVAQRDPTREWMIGEAGVLVDDCSNVDDMMKAITESHTTKYGDKPREQAKNFSWDKTVSKYEDAIQEII